LAKYATGQIRNVSLVAHNGAGKTSLADALYFTAGGTNRQGSVDDQTSLSDYEPEEQKRGSSIQTAVLPCDWKGHRINVLDTPGYPDFRGEMMSALRVSDAALMVISAAAGIEVGARQAWQLCDEFELPRAIIVNKLDRDNTSFEEVVEELVELWGRKCVPAQVPDGAASSFKGVTSLLDNPAVDPDAYEQLVEAIAETDDDLTEKYLEGEELSKEELSAGLKSGFMSGEIVPVFATSASANIGTSELMDAIAGYFPSPADAPSQDVPTGTNACLVFKTTADPFVGKLSFFRIYGAPLSGQDQLWNCNRSANERLGQIYQPAGKETVPVDSLPTGDIGVVAKLSETRTFDTLGDRGEPLILEGVDLPKPIFSLAVSPNSQADLDKMGPALQRISEEDPTLVVERNSETSQTVLCGLGDIHVQMAIERIRRKFDVELKTSLPKIAYRETISTGTTTAYRHKKQTGGAGQFGHVVMRLSPLPAGEGIQFSSKVVGGNVPREYIPSVEKGVRSAAAAGVLAGFPVVDAEVVLVDGSSHSVDSSGTAFEIAGSMGFRQGVKDARPQLLEPIVKANILIPDTAVGDVMGDLNTRRARISGMEPRGVGFTEVSAEVPASLMLRYAADLRSLTQAQGVFSTEFDHYEPVPPQDAGRVIEALSAEAS
jgi:elongation factor G